MSRVIALSIVFGIATPLGGASGQLSGGIGPVARSASTTGSEWRASAQLASSLRFESPNAFLTIDGSIDRRGGSTALGPLTVSPFVLSPALGQFRLVSSAEYTRDSSDPATLSTLSATSSLTYRRGHTGTWIGSKAERNANSSFVSGFWRQLGSRAVIAIASTIRRGSFGAAPPRIWTETHWDSVYTDSSGWQKYSEQRLYGDSGSTGRRRTWAETEARIGWAAGRVALDGVVGWRPSIDTSKHAAWVRGFATVGLARNVALSLGVGTTTRQLPYARSTGRFGLVALRFAPAALVRPKGTPEITAVASAFTVERADGDEYVVHVRLPRARVVELSGDFNSWKPVRLTRATENTWVVSLALKPGTYRMNLRVDGEQWLPPPGTTAVDDEFNGRVGIVIIR